MGKRNYFSARGWGKGGRLSLKTLFIYVAGHADVLKRWLCILIA